MNNEFVGSTPEAQKAELIAKVGQYVKTWFDGDYKAAFDHTDLDKNGLISIGELEGFLSSCGVGNIFTRYSWAKEVQSNLDKDNDGMISWKEFEEVLSKGH